MSNVPVESDAPASAPPSETKPKRAATSAKPAKKAKAAKKARPAKKPRPAASARSNKKAEGIAMMKRAKGATITEIVKATGWQKHTVRGFISGTLGKKMGLTVASEKGEDGERRYSIKG